MKRQQAACLFAFLIAMAVAGTANGAASRPQLDPAGPVPGPPCVRPFSSTLVETSKVRVYAMPAEPPEHPEHIHPAFFGRPVFACLKKADNRLLLNLPEADAEKRPLWVEVHQAIAVSGPLVAYAYTQYYLDTHETWIRVRSLRTGTVIRSCPAGGDIAPGSLPHIAKIVLNSRGWVGWSSEGYEGRSIFGCGPAGPTRLDHGEGIELESLRLEDSVLHWIDAGEEREAALS